MKKACGSRCGVSRRRNLRLLATDPCSWLIDDDKKYFTECENSYWGMWRTSRGVASVLRFGPIARKP